MLNSNWSPALPLIPFVSECVASSWIMEVGPLAIVSPWRPHNNITFSLRTNSTRNNKISKKGGTKSQHLDGNAAQIRLFTQNSVYPCPNARAYTPNVRSNDTNGEQFAAERGLEKIAATRRHLVVSLWGFNEVEVVYIPGWWHSALFHFCLSHTQL